MIQVRNVFRLKFGKAKEAKELWKEVLPIQKKYGYGPAKAFADVSGPFYTFVLEFTFNDLADFEKRSKETMGQPDFQAWYHKFSAIIESGTREIYTILE